MIIAKKYPFYAGFKEGHVTPIAHRFGTAAGEDVQNTAKALEAALNLDYDYFETDAAVTADGKVIFVHESDKEPDNQAKGIPTSQQIRMRTYSQLIDYFPIGGEDIPLAEDILKNYPQARFFIDPKQQDVIHPLAELVAKLDRENSVAIGAWAQKRALETIKLLGSVDTIPTCVGPMGIFALIGAGLYLPLGKSYLKRNRAASVQSPLEIMTARRVKVVHDMGGKAIVWTKRTTPETPEEIMKAINRGVDGIMADNVVLLKEVIRSLGLE